MPVISKDFRFGNMKKTVLTGNVEAFAVDYDPIHNSDNSDIIDIHL